MSSDDLPVGLRGYRIIDAGRTAERRAAVIRAAARVFADKGYRDATMDDIAQEMGVSKGVLYYQFRSKEEVYTEIIVTAITEALRLLRATVSAPGSPAERLQRALRELIAFNLEESTAGYYSKMVSGNLRSLKGPSRELIREHQRAYQQVIVDLVREGQAQGLFAVRHPSVVAMNLLTAANGVSNWFVAGRALDAAAVADEISSQLVRGLRTAAPA